MVISDEERCLILMENIVYQNYHKHDFYSNPVVPDSVESPKSYAKRAVELGHGIISSVNHGWQGKYIEHYELAQQYNLKFLFGVEAYWVKDISALDENGKKDGTNNHIVLLAKNENGRRNINRILSESVKNPNGFYYRQRIDIPMILSLPKDDVWVTTACLAGWGYGDESIEIFKLFHEHFNDNFFFEVQPHNIETQVRLNKKIKQLSAKLNIKMIAGIDSHYIDEADAWQRDDYQKSKGIFYEEEQGWFMDYPDGNTLFHRFQQQNVFTDEEIYDFINRTNLFLEVEEYTSDIFNKNIKMMNPYPDMDKKDRINKFLNLILEKIKERFAELDKKERKKYLSEIKKEIKTVLDTDHVDYFLANYEMVKKGIENGGIITPTGRGSGCSFYLNNLLGFTKIDRINAPVPLFPERFMSTTRMLETKSLADIDHNVNNRDPFIKAHIELFGEQHAIPMFALGTMKEKSAWQMYAKAMDINFEIANDVSKQIMEYEKNHKYDETINIYDYIDEKYHEYFDKSKKYLGIVTDWKIAPSAILVYPENIEEEIGLVKCKDNICCVIDKSWAEEYKFLKDDILLVNSIDLIYKIFNRIGVKNEDVPDINTLIQLCEKDTLAWDIYKNGYVMGINQVEQDGAKKKVMKYQPKNISELSAFIAAIRPGFKSMYPIFESREHFDYGIPVFDKIIQTKDMTSTFVLYQENTMQVLNFSGIPMDETYGIVKAISKKNKEKIIKYKERMISGFKKKIIEIEHLSEPESEEIAENVWQILEDSSEYSFNSCLSGDTIFYTENKEEVDKYTIEYFFHHREMFCKKIFSMRNDKTIVENNIVDIREAGVQKLYTVITETWERITCTMNHKFPTPKGLRKLQNLKIGDDLYVQSVSYKNHTCERKAIPSKIKYIEYFGEEMTYDVEMKAPYHNFVVNNGIVTSNSHSYSMALDSLYGAYLKSHYPLEFYECFLNQLIATNEKDRAQKAKDEALSAFGIKIKAPRFGDDNRKFTVIYEDNCITDSLASIKSFGDNVGEELYSLGQNTYDHFVDLLEDLFKTTINKTQIKSLIYLNYFEKFGKNKKLIGFFDYFDLLHDVKQINKKQIGKKFPFAEEFIKKYANKETASLYKELNIKQMLNDLFDILEDKPLSLKVQLLKEKEILGKVVSVNEDIPENWYFVEEMKIYQNPFKPYLLLYNLKYGTSLRTKIVSDRDFSENPFKVDSIIQINSYKERKKMKKVGETYVRTDETEKVIGDYIVIVQS